MRPTPREVPAHSAPQLRAGRAPSANPTTPPSEATEPTTIPAAAAEESTSPAKFELALTPAPLEPNPSARPAELNALLQASAISCQFDQGGSGAWRDGPPTRPTPGGARSEVWTQGPITFQEIDLTSGMAQMNASVAFTGAVAPSIGVQVAATNKGLHFFVFTPKGELVMTTVMPLVDGSIRYRAMTSRHGRQFDDNSSLFYGACDLEARK